MRFYEILLRSSKFILLVSSFSFLEHPVEWNEHLITHGMKLVFMIRVVLFYTPMVVAVESGSKWKLCIAVWSYMQQSNLLILSLRCLHLFFLFSILAAWFSSYPKQIRELVNNTRRLAVSTFTHFLNLKVTQEILLYKSYWLMTSSTRHLIYVYFKKPDTNFYDVNKNFKMTSSIIFFCQWSWIVKLLSWYHLRYSMVPNFLYNKSTCSDRPKKWTIFTWEESFKMKIFFELNFLDVK